MSTKRDSYTRTKKRQTDQPSRQSETYLTFKYSRLQNCHKSNRKKIGSCFAFVINPDQTGYIKGRFIGENVRLISDIINYTSTKTLPGLAVFLDFEKAFDSMEWNFLFKVPDRLNFGPD